MPLLTALGLPPKTPASRPAAPPAPAKRAPDSGAKGSTVPPPPPDGPVSVGWKLQQGKESVSYKDTGDAQAVKFSNEVKKIDLVKQNFKVWVIPCYTKAGIKISVEGEFSAKKDASAAGVKAQLKVAGQFELGVGGTCDWGTAGPFGQAELSCNQGVTVKYSDKGGWEADAFIAEICAVGKVGIKAEITDGPTVSYEAELANWQLFIVHVAGWKDGKFQGWRAEPGRDMQRFIAAMQQAGPKIADAVDKYAPESVKKAAEDAARWAAESDDAKAIADGTGKVLDVVKDKTGVDIGAGAERAVQFLADPGGETGADTTARIEAELKAANEAHADFRAVMQASGLDSAPLKSRNKAEMDEYNAIVDAKNSGGDWRPMVEALVKTRRARRAEEARKKKAAADAEAAQAAEDLARRVKEADAAADAALTAANMLGNPLNNRTKDTPDAKARKFWEQGMLKYWQPGSAARLAAKKMQGEARIAKSREAADLLAKARTVFQQGMQQL